jgi:hypothetical protein
VDRNIDGAAIFVCQLLRERTNQFGALSRSQLVRQDDENFSSEQGIPLPTSVLRSIPQSGSFPRPVHQRTTGELRGKYDLLMGNVVPTGEVADLARPLVNDALARTIGGGSRNPRASTPGEGLDP